MQKRLKVKSMEIQLVRIEKNPWGTDGRLYINRHHVCDTVEHPTRCMPRGVYRIDLENNPFRHGDGPMKSTRGEIIVGKNALPGLVVQSRETYDRLYERLRKTWQRGKEIRLSIY